MAAEEEEEGKWEMDPLEMKKINSAKGFLSLSSGCLSTKDGQDPQSHSEPNERGIMNWHGIFLRKSQTPIWRIANWP